MLYVLFITLFTLFASVILCRLLSGWTLVVAQIALLLIVVGVSWFMISRFTKTYSTIENGLEHFAADSTYRFIPDEFRGYDEQRLAIAMNVLFSQIANADEVSTEMLHNISHEIKTPLTSLRILVEGIEDGIFPADAEHLGMLSDAAKRIDETVTVMKRYSDIGSVDELVLCDVSEPFMGTMKKMKAVLSEQNVEVNLVGKMSDDFAVHTMATPALLTTLFESVAFNAVDHAVGMTKLEFSIETTFNPVYNTEMIKVSISDNGCGIPKDKLAKVKTPFYKVDESHNSSYNGHKVSIGLGLPMAEKIMNSIGGMLEVSSRENVGTSVAMWFHIAEEATKAA